MNTSPLTIVAIATAAPGQEAALRAAQEQLVADTVKESGCLRYELHQSREDGRVLVFVESWASEAQWRGHMGGGGMKSFPASGASKLIADFSLLQMSLVTDGSPTSKANANA